MTILPTISQNILVSFLLKVLPRVENTHSEGTELNTIWIDIEYLVFFAATRHFAIFDWFHKISGLNSFLKDEECFQRNQLCFLMKIGLVFGLCSIFARCLLGYRSISARLCSKSNKKSCSKNDLCSLGFARARRRSKLFPLELGSARKSFLVISLALGSARKFFRSARSSSKNIRSYPTLCHVSMSLLYDKSKFRSYFLFICKSKTFWSYGWT